MKLNKTLLAAALFGAMGISTAAQAITVQGITFAEGANFEFMEIAESEQPGFGNGNGIVDQVGERLHGILRITSITDGLGNQLWATGDGGRELTGYFHDYLVTEITASGGKSYIGFTGGQIDIYSDNTRDFERNGSQADDIAKATDSDFGTPWLSLVGSRILNDASPLVNAGDLQTLRAEFGALALVGAISGNGLLDVVGGAAAQYLDTDQFVACNADQSVCDVADKTFTSSGQTNTTSANRPWALVGTGEIQDVAEIPVPEPTSLALLGAAFAGISAFGIRRRK